MNMPENPKQHAALDAAIEHRSKTRAHLESNAAAIALAEQAAADASATLQQAEQKYLDKKSEKAAMAAATFLSGGKDIGPITVDEKIMLAKVSALARQDLCADVLKQLRERHAKAEQDLHHAQAEVVQIVDQILDAEAEAIAGEIESHLSEASRLGAKLRQYVPDPLQMPVNSQHATSPRIQKALSSLPARDDLNTPGNLLRLEAPAEHASVSARRAALIALARRSPTNDSKAA
jgi:hypothetical protein